MDLLKAIEPMKPYLVLICALFLSPFPCQGRSTAEDHALARAILEDDSLLKVDRMCRDLLKEGFTAGDGYPQVWIRDLNTFIETSCEVYDTRVIRTNLLTFFKLQQANGEIVDGYVLKGHGDISDPILYTSESDTNHVGFKNTVESDQEASLIQAIGKYIRKTGDRSILDEMVNGRTVRERMAWSLEFLLKERFSQKYRLITGATRQDWGDVQPEHAWGVDVDANTHWAISIYDNAMFILALDEMIGFAKTPGDNRKWRTLRDQTANNVRRYLWDSKRGKFVPHIYLKDSPFPADFDESAIHFHGGTATAISAGLLSKKEIAMVNRQMVQNVKEAGATSIGLTLYPPYPKGLFKNPQTTAPYTYQNGGDWPWFGGRMIQELIRNGFIQEAFDEIRPMTSRILRDEGLYEWYDREGKPNGSGKFKGTAGVLSKAIGMLRQWAEQTVAQQASANGSTPHGSGEVSPFSIRGTLPWHNFLSGPTAWNEADYRAYLDEMAAKKLNFIGFHNYTGGAERYAPYVEPMIRMSYRGVVPEAGFDTSLTARWGYRPLAVQDFAFGTDKLFHLPRGAKAFGSDCAVTALNNEDRYKKAHDLMRKVVGMAHARGIQVAMGFEFGIHPPEFASVVPPESRIGGAMLPDPTHPANIAILHSALDDIVDSYPGVDWVWLWLHEHSMFIGEPQLDGKFGGFYAREQSNFGDSNKHDVFTGVWSLAYIQEAQKYLAKRSPNTRLVIGGWGGGAQLPPVLKGLDRALPTNIVFSCLNPEMGVRGHLSVLNEIARHRTVWSMPWLEGDAWLWHLQFRAGSILDQVKTAKEANLAGVVAIHWRTEEVQPNLEALAAGTASSGQMPSAGEIYSQHCLKRYGPEAVAGLVPVMLDWEQQKLLGSLSSPVYFPYAPSWGRMTPELAVELKKQVALIEGIRKRTALALHQDHLDWLADNLRFALLLDEVGRKIEPAYRLKEQQERGEIQGAELTRHAEAVRRIFATAPIEGLFRTFARRVRSRGELGEMSSLNQRVWLQYRDLDQFLASACSGK